MVKKNYLVNLKRIIIIMIALISIICMHNVTKAETTGNSVQINLGAGSAQKIDGLVFTYRKNGAYNYNLFCAQKGAKLDSRHSYTYNEYVWANDSGIFKSEDEYNKITWIKNNIWYYYPATESNKYSYAEITTILNIVNPNITEEQVKSVFGNEKKLYKVYQYVAWDYTNNNQSVNSSALQKNDSTAYTIYKAITDLANKYYKTGSNLTATADSKVSYENGKFIWKNVSITNTFLLNYNLKVYVDGEEYQNYKYNSNAKTIEFSELTPEENHTFSFEATVPTVSCSASIWIHNSKQNMLEITDSNRELKTVSKNAVYTITEKEKYEDGTFNLVLNKVDESGNAINNVEFKLSKQGTDESETLKSAQNSNSATKTGIEINNDDIIRYRISEIKVGNSDDYVKITEKIGITITTGVIYDKTEIQDGVKTTYYRYYVKNVTFSNGTNKQIVRTANGDEVELTLQTSGEKSNITATITVPNKHKKFDLALTKTIVTKKTVQLNYILDFNDNNKLDKVDVFVLESVYAKQNAGIEDNLAKLLKDSIQEALISQEGMNETDAKAKTNEIYNKKYKEYESNEQALSEMFDLDNNGLIGIQDACILATSNNIKDYIATTGRINGIDLNNLRSNESTTATYNMKKDTITVKNNDIVIYEIKVYNEGDYDSKNIQVYDYIPEGLTLCDINGNTVTSGSVTYTYNGKDYVWEVLDNGKTAKTTITDTIKSFSSNHLSNASVFIACKVDKDVEDGKILYNVAAIRGAEAVNSEGKTIGVQDQDGFIDRDSDTNVPVDSSSTQNLIDQYSSRFESNSIDEDDTSINKDVYEYQDDDDFDRVIVENKSEFDLALRKSISKIGTDESSMKETENSRLPQITEDSVDECIVSGTGEYYHPKEAVKVNVGDYVEYTLRVYNEGSSKDYSGYASQIKDYLPTGVQFYAVVNSDGKWITQASDGKYKTTLNDYGSYEVAYDSQNNVVTIDYIKSKAILRPTNNLLNVYSIYNDETGELVLKGYYTATEYNDKEDAASYAYQEVKIICKVTEQITENKNLTNLAEITNSTTAEIEEDGSIKEDTTVVDKDSTAGNIQITTEETDKSENKVNLDTYYEDNTVNDTYIDYYPGIEDDDDFETIIVETETIIPDVPTPHKGVKDVQNQDSGYDATTPHDWVIQAEVPQGINNFNKYVIVDPIDERLVFSGTETVKVSIVNGNELVEGTDYKVSYDEQTATLKISFIEDEFVAGKQLTPGSVIEIRFNTTFATDENGNIIALNQAVPNQAELIYDNGSGTEESKKTETPEVHTGAVAVYKYNEKTNVALEGAEFKIATSKENAQNGVFVKDAQGNDLVAISNSQGIATFTGLEFGGDAMDNEENKQTDSTTGATVYKYDFNEAKTTYYIVETKAPEGFLKYDEIIEVEVSKNTTLTEIEDMESIANKPLNFDLALRKWVTEAIVTENGKTTVTETGHKAEDDPEQVVKVDLKKSKINDVIVKFKYSIRVTNEGDIAGEAQEISDYIPNGLKFDPADNPQWTEVDGKVVTDELSGTILQPGESAEVEIILTWINSESNMGVMTNTAEISKDYNEYGAPDIDSTPNNQVPGEDDIDDAPVMLTVKTGSEIIMYVSLALGFLAIIGSGAVLIKKKVLLK